MIVKKGLIVPAATLYELAETGIDAKVVRRRRTCRIVSRKIGRDGKNGVVNADQRTDLRLLKADVTARDLDVVVVL